LVSAFINIRQLAEQGRLDEARASPIARFAIAAYRCGRCGGLPQNSTDIFADRCRFLGRSVIKYTGVTDAFAAEIVKPHMQSSVFRQVSFKIDFFESWHAELSDSDKRFIRDLGMGDTPGEVAVKYRISPSRVSQIRRRLADSWYEFISEE